MTTIEVRNSLRVVVYTTNLAELAFKFVASRQDLGKLEVIEVTTTVTERPLKPAVVTPIRAKRIA